MPPATRPAAQPGILLVEEQTGSRNLITLVLSRLGYTVEAVASCHEALDRLARYPYAIVLLSSTLPDGEGVEAVRRVRTVPGRPDAPAVLVMGGEEAGTRGASLGIGASGYLQRPVEIDPLLRSIRNVLAARPAPHQKRPAAEPAVDVDHLRGFTDGDAQLESELFELYLSTAEVYLERMSGALANPDAWVEAVHALKGASNNLGARRVADLAREAEHAAPDADRLAAIRKAVDEVRDFFTARQQQP